LWARGGAVAIADASRTHAHVRLLALPERIKAELNEAMHGLELALLRSLWKRARGGMHLGVVADLDALPPGIGGAMGAQQLLDALQAKQFLVWKRLGEGITLTDSARELKDWPIDWELLDRRRRGELRKLEMVQQYAYTKFCRRAFVLRYFGDPAAKPSCANCDNCMGIKHEPRAAAVQGKPARDRSGASKFSGSQSAGSKSAGAKSAGSKSAARGAVKAGTTDAPFSREESTRMDVLRALRSRLAKDEEVPAYVIFPDRALREMARANPQSIAQLALVHGVGPTRLDKFGRAVLEALQSA